MAGTKAGGLKAAATNKERHGAGFYAEIGAKGGAKTTGMKGFALIPAEKRREYGRIGGRKSTRKGVVTKRATD